MAITKVTLPVARKMKNLTQKDLADFCGVSESTVFNWEKGKSEPTVSQAQLAAAACGLDLDDILFLPSTTV